MGAVGDGGDKIHSMCLLTLALDVRKGEGANWEVA
jgi:hypothetical protein